MTARFSPTRPSEQGQMLVIVAGALVALLMVVGLVIDAGIGFQSRRDAQNVADLASMAGAKVVAEHYLDGGRAGADVHAAIDANTADNGCTAGGGCTWEAVYVDNAETNRGAVTAGDPIPPGAQGVRVTVSRTPATFFMRVFGQAQLDVQAPGTALTAEVGGLPPGQVLPIGIDPPNTLFDDGEVYELTAGKDAPGNFSWLSWNGANDPNTLATSICTPNNPGMTFPVYIDGDPGKSNSSSVRACVDMWIANGATVLLPLWDHTVGNGNNTQFHVIGLAAFVLVDRGQPAIDSIQGRFVGYYGLPSVGANYGGPPTDCTNPQGGQSPCNAAYFIGLVR